MTRMLNLRDIFELVDHILILERASGHAQVMSEAVARSSFPRGILPDVDGSGRSPLKR